jgi:Leucine-rich repeat (LRR) protein
MKYIFLTTILFFSSSCEPNYIFKGLENKEYVFINLKKYGLDSIPKEIGKLKKVKELEILMESTDGWTIYPPLSAIDKWIDEPPFRSIPSELLYLNGLEKLTLHGLNIQRLPEGLDKLENLKYLDLSMNKLTISKEIPKLKKIKKLKYLQLFGNRINKLEIEEWRKDSPNIKIEYDWE